MSGAVHAWATLWAKFGSRPFAVVGLEAGISSDVAADLSRRGHRFLAAAPTVLFGGPQIIQRVGEAFWGGSDPRKDGQAIGL